MAEAFAVRPEPLSSRSSQDLAERLRTSLRDARGNVEIRRRLQLLARDPERLAALQRELGPSHALLRDLVGLAALKPPVRPVL